MKFLAVFLALGFACAFAVPLNSRSQDLEFRNEAEDHAVLEAEEKKILEEVQQELKERFEKILQKIRDVVNQGKEIKETTKQKLKELREKLANLNDHDKEILNRLREKGREFLKGILEGLGLGKKDVDQHTEDILLAAENDFDVTTLREKFQELVKRVKDAFEQGKGVNDALEKLQKLRETLKLLNIDLGEKGREYIDILKEKVKDYFRNLKEKWTSKRNADIDVFGMLEELKHQIRESFNVDKIKEYIEKVFGLKGGELKKHLLKYLNENGGKQKILDWINIVLGKKEEMQSVSGVYEKLKEFFKDLHIELKEKLSNFAEWVKGKYENGLEKGKNKIENVTKIAKEFLKDSQRISKNMALEAMIFFHEYREDLGDLYDDLVEKISDILKS